MKNMVILALALNIAVLVPVTVLNPVVVSNLGIAAFHTVTLLMIWKEIGKQIKPH